MKLRKKFKMLDVIFYLNNLQKVLNFHSLNENFSIYSKIINNYLSILSL